MYSYIAIALVLFVRILFVFNPMRLNRMKPDFPSSALILSDNNNTLLSISIGVISICIEWRTIFRKLCIKGHWYQRSILIPIENIHFNRDKFTVIITMIMHFRFRQHIIFVAFFLYCFTRIILFYYYIIKYNSRKAEGKIELACGFCFCMIIIVL